MSEEIHKKALGVPVTCPLTCVQVQDEGEAALGPQSLRSRKRRWRDSRGPEAGVGGGGQGALTRDPEQPGRQRTRGACTHTRGHPPTHVHTRVHTHTLTHTLTHTHADTHSLTHSLTHAHTFSHVQV